MGPVGGQATANSQLRLYGLLAPVGWLPLLVVRRCWSSVAVGASPLLVVRRCWSPDQQQQFGRHPPPVLIA